MSHHPLVNILLITRMGFLSSQRVTVTNIDKEPTAKSEHDGTVMCA
ncbi:MAG: hypothetical protein ACI910_001741 [Oleispira sp.]|jgi:hypothetical protein